MTDRNAMTSLRKLLPLICCLALTAPRASAQDNTAEGAAAPAAAGAAGDETPSAPLSPPAKKPRRRRASQVGEIEPHRFIFEAGVGTSLRLWAGDVTGLRFTPLVDIGLGVNFNNRKWGLLSLTRFSLNDLGHGRGNYAGWSVIGLHRHRPREADTYGLGVAFREVPDASAPGGYRRQYGGAAVWRVEFLDKPFTYYFNTDLACYPGQCALSLGVGLGFYF